MNNNITIILHAPQMGENIGAAARAMFNFGFEDLRIVAPRDGWPNAKALEMAAGAKNVVEKARVYANLSDAIADLQTVYATTARTRDMDKEVITPKGLAHEIPTQGKIGIVFGAERTGLENKDASLADKIISIPVSEKYQSLNLGQSVGIICYELFSSNVQAMPAERELASKQEFVSMIDHLEIELDGSHFFQVQDKKPNMMINIRNMFARAKFSPQEMRTMRGIIRSLSQK